MKRHTSRAVALVALTLAVGCSSLSLERLRLSDLRDQSETNGLVVSVTQPHQVVAVFGAEPGSNTLVEFQNTVNLPAVDEYYIIGYRGDLFFSRELQLELHPDSSLKRVKMTSTSTAADDLQSIGTALQGVQTELTEIEERKAARPDPTDTENERLRREILNAMLKVNQDDIAAKRTPTYNDIKLP